MHNKWNIYINLKPAGGDARSSAGGWVGATAEEEAWSPRGLGNLDPGRNCRIPWASGLARPGPWGGSGGTGPLPCLLNLFIDLGVRRGSRRVGGTVEE